MELFSGRPNDITGRTETEIRVYEMLEKLAISYQRTDHEAADTMEACEEIDKVLGVSMCKNLFLCNRKQTKFYLLMMLGEKPFKTKELYCRRPGRRPRDLIFKTCASFFV